MHNERATQVVKIKLWKNPHSKNIELPTVGSILGFLVPKGGWTGGAMWVRIVIISIQFEWYNICCQHYY